jgi:hypothetical protein
VASTRPIRPDLRTLIPSQSRKRAQNTLGGAGRAVRIHIQKSLHTLHEVALSPPRHMVGRTVIAMVRDIVAAADAVDILLNDGAADAAAPNARVLLELFAGLLYLVGRSDERIALGRQALVFEQVISEVEDQRASFVLLNPGGRVGPFDETIANIRGDLERFLADSHLHREVRREIEHRRSRQSTPVRWYQLFGGPRTLRGVFRRTGLEVLYDTSYRPWSEASHGRADFSNGVLLADEPVRHLKPVRQHREDLMAQMLAVILLVLRVSLIILAEYGEIRGRDVIEELEGRMGDVGPSPLAAQYESWTNTLVAQAHGISRVLAGLGAARLTPENTNGSTGARAV